MGAAGSLSWSRLISALIAAAYACIGLLFDGLNGAALAILFLALPLACIWFSEILGSYAPFSSSFFGITEESPEQAVRFVGWMLLVLPAFIPVIAYIAAA